MRVILVTNAFLFQDLEKAGDGILLSLRDCGILMKFLLSVIYPWSDDPSAEYDLQVLGALQLAKRPQKPHLGCLSMAGYLTLRIPCKSVLQFRFGLPRLHQNVHHLSMLLDCVAFNAN